MRFTGRVRFGDVQDADLDVIVEVTDTHVRFVSGDESLGSWCLADVVANRVVANEFEIDLEGERLVFLADDQVNFAYGAVQKMAEGWARYHAMNLVRRKRAVASARRHNEPNRLETVRRAFVTAHEELQRPDPVVETPAPEVVEVETMSPELDTTSSPEEPHQEDPSVAGHRFWDRVEAATAAEKTPTPVEEPPVDGPAPTGAGRLPRLNAFPRRRLDAEVVSAEAEREVVSAEAEREVVSAEAEREVVSAEAEREVASAEAEPEVVEPTTPDVEPAGEPGVDDGAAETQSPEADKEVTNGHRPVGTPQPVALGSYRDGHHPAETSGLRASLRSMFSRSNEPHEHSFVESTTAVGITRRVCLECGHVSIGVSE